MDRFPFFALILAAIPIFASGQDLTWSALLLGFILAGTAALHVYNLWRVHRKIESLEHSRITKESFYNEVAINQGSNFSALAFAAWMMLIVAIAYLYFLVPAVLDISYMQIPGLASSSFGFVTFGLFVALGESIFILGLDKLPESYREFKLTELYCFYPLAKNAKRMIVLTIPALCISIFCSAYIGTIYPEHSSLAENLALTLLAVSAGTLVAIVYKDAVEG